MAVIQTSYTHHNYSFKHCCLLLIIYNYFVHTNEDRHADKGKDKHTHTRTNTQTLQLPYKLSEVTQTPEDRYGQHKQMCQTENKWMAAHQHCVAVMKCMAQKGSLQAQPNHVRVPPDPRDDRRGDVIVTVSGHETLTRH